MLIIRIDQRLRIMLLIPVAVVIAFGFAALFEEVISVLFHPFGARFLPAKAVGEAIFFLFRSFEFPVIVIHSD